MKRIKAVFLVAVALFVLSLSIRPIYAEEVETEPVTTETQEEVIEWVETVYTYTEGEKTYTITLKDEVTLEIVLVGSEEVETVTSEYTLEENKLTFTMNDEPKMFVIGEKNILTVYVADNPPDEEPTEEHMTPAELLDSLKTDVIPFVVQLVISYGTTVLALAISLKKVIGAKGAVQDAEKLVKETIETALKLSAEAKVKYDGALELIEDMKKAYDKVLDENEELKEFMKETNKNLIKLISASDELVISGEAEKTIKQLKGE